MPGGKSGKTAAWQPGYILVAWIPLLDTNYPAEVVFESVSASAMAKKDRLAVSPRVSFF